MLSAIAFARVRPCPAAQRRPVGARYAEEVPVMNGRQPINLLLTSRRGYHPGRSYAYRALWLLVEAAVLLNPVVTPYWLKRSVLRLFGARIGSHVQIKP